MTGYVSSIMLALTLALPVTQGWAGTPGLTVGEKFCAQYATLMEVIATGRDRGMHLTDILGILRRTQLGAPATEQAALEHGALWVYTSTWLTPLRIRQQAEVECITPTLAPTTPRLR